MKRLHYLLLILAGFFLVGILAGVFARGSPSGNASLADRGQAQELVPTWTATFTVKQVEVASRTPTPKPPTPTATPPPSVIANKLINVRNGPGTNYRIIGQANGGDKFTVTAKNPGLGDWWQIDYKGEKGWVYSGIVVPSNTRNVQVTTFIPAPPSAATAKPVPTAKPVALATNTPVTRSRTNQRCTFAGTEPRVPDPEGLAVYDCEAWDMAYFLLVHDRPEVMFASFKNNVRLEMTHLMYNLLREAMLNCNADMHVLVGIVMVAGEQIENHGSPRDIEVLSAPRAATLGGLKSVPGGEEMCYSVLDEWLRFQLSR